MPETTGNKVLSTGVLTRTTPLSLSDWEVLIEDRVAMLRPHWDELATRELATAFHLRSCSTRRHLIREDDPKFERIFPDGSRDKNFELERALYGDEFKARRVTIPNSGYVPDGLLGDYGARDGVLLSWRIMESRTWSIVRVHFIGIRDPEVDKLDDSHAMNIAGWFSGYEKATLVEVQPMELGELIQTLAINPLEIWLRLGEALIQLTSHRRRLYESLQALERRVQHEEEMFRHVPN